jgi:hypothetical protein
LDDAGLRPSIHESMSDPPVGVVYGFCCLPGLVGRGAGAGYTFVDVKSTTDPSFTQLLGVNDTQEVAGYYGCGTPPNHPNKGFTLLFSNSNNGPFTGTPTFTPENFPGSVQDQNFGVNNLGNPSTAGFWQDANGVDHGT